MPSSVSWVQFDEREMQAATQFLSDLSQGVVDELGFGKIRAYYADLFFPATTTIMTRPRYLIFLPALIVKASGSVRTLDTLQNKLREALVNTDKDMDGVIGRRAKDKIDRHPSGIYWKGLHDLKIVKPDCSLASLLQKLKKEAEAGRDDDKQSEGYGLGAFLNIETLNLGRKALFDPRKTGAFRDLTLDMTKVPKEREHLIDLYMKKSPGSLMSFLFENPKAIKDDFWRIKLPPGHPLEQPLRDATGFSMTAWGAYLVYRLLLARKANATTMIEACEKAVASWRASTEFRTFVEGWSAELALARLAAAEKRVLRRTSLVDDQAFIKALHAAFLANSNFTDLIQVVAPFIEKRERQIKPGRAKLDKSEISVSDEDETPDPKRRMLVDYRWGVAKRFLDDLVGGGHV